MPSSRPLLTLVLLLSTAFAFNSTIDGPCVQTNNKIQVGTLQLQGDCAPSQFCGSNGFCQNKGCRRDDFPFGYNSTMELPPKCPDGSFCPDEGDQCFPLQKVGDQCQLNRDDECEAPPNFKELAGDLRQNFNGSICLKTICMWANVSVGQECIVDNTPFTAYGPSNSEFIDVVSRDNCKKDLYCDATSSPTLCVNKKSFGEGCSSDKECLSNSCASSLTCGLPANAPKHFATWVYALVAIAIIGGMVGTLVGLFFIHSRFRDQDREKRMQYWREQNAFRQNILQMRETAQTSMHSYGVQDGMQSNRSSRYGLTSEDSQMPMLPSKASPSGLRNQVSDDDRDGAEIGLMSQRKSKGRKLSLRSVGNRI